MNECGSSKQQLMTLYKQLNYDVVSKIKEWKDNNVLLYQKIIDCCETTNGNLSDIADILDEYIVILSDCCRTINGNLTLILEGAEQICIECVHLPVTTTTTEECEPGTTEEPDITTEEPVYTTGEPGPEECDQPTEFHDKGTFYPYMVEKFLGPDTGMVTLDFDTYDIPDRFVVIFGGKAVINTGYHGNPIFEPRLNAALALLGVAPVSVNASQVGQASFIKKTAEDTAYVLVYAPLRNTAFNFILSCPGPYTTTTSEEEEVTTTSEETVATTTEEQTLTTTEPEVVTTTSEEQVLTTTGEPCLLDVEVLYPPQPEVTTTTEEPVTTTTEEPATTTTSAEEVVTTTSGEPVTTTTTEEPVTTTTTEYVPDAFIFEINVDAETIALPLLAVDDDGNAATHNFTVYWDWKNHPETSESINSTTAEHTYTTPGLYVVVVEGTCQTFATRSKTGSTTHPIAQKITRVLRWGTVADFKLLNFYGCINLTELPHDVTEEPYVGSDGTITGAANINTFENFLYSCINYKHKANGFMFVECPSVITFKYTFGSSGITDVDDFIFEQNELVQSFYGTFSFCSGLDIEIPAALFSTNSAVIRFDFTFANSAVKGIVPDTLFAWCPEVKYFIRTFRSTLITGLLSDHLFWGNSKVESFEGTFHNCLYLGSSAIYPTVYTNNLFVKNTAVISFQETFHICQSINNQLPADLFKENTKAENFGYTFGNNYLVYGDIPATLFSRCPKAKYFNGTFSIGGSVKYALGSGGTGTIPVDLFASNPDAETFELTFRWQGSLLKVPNGLFRNNLKATNFNGTFVSCPNLKVGDSPYTESYPFSAIDPLILGDTEATAALRRFTGKVMIFTGTFGLPAWQGAANTRFAPELWDPAKYDYISATYAACFIWSSGYNPYTNYASIPSGWK